MPLTLGWTRDQRDSALVPTAGRYKRVNLDYAAARRRAATCAPTCRYQQYIPLTRAFTLGVNAEVG